MPSNRDVSSKQEWVPPVNPVQIPGSAYCRQVNSADLLGGDEVLRIQHQGDSYLLRQTRAGKLILTK